MSRTYHHDARHRKPVTRARNRRGHILPTDEQRILDLLAEIPPRGHDALAALVIPAHSTRPIPSWDAITDTAMTGVAPRGTTSEDRILRLLSA